MEKKINNFNTFFFTKKKSLYDSCEVWDVFVCYNFLTYQKMRIEIEIERMFRRNEGFNYLLVNSSPLFFFLFRQSCS